SCPFPSLGLRSSRRFGSSHYARRHLLQNLIGEADHPALLPTASSRTGRPLFQYLSFSTGPEASPRS
ncbi:unnamed protein product, partial [Ectocarpus sp. 13 AM-2016]